MDYFLDQPVNRANPANGKFYSDAELDRIWAIPVTGGEYVDGPIYRRWEYFLHAVKFNWNHHQDGDNWARGILEKAILAEIQNPDTDEYPYNPETDPQRGTTGPMSTDKGSGLNPDARAIAYAGGGWPLRCNHQDPDLSVCGAILDDPLQTKCRFHRNEGETLNNK